MVKIGKITSAVGIRGEMRVNLYAEQSSNLRKGVVLHIERGRETLECEVVGVRYQNNRPVIKLEGVNDRTAAEEFRNLEIGISEEDLEELPEGEFYVKDLIGFEVYDIASNAVIGKVEDYIQNRAQALWDVRSDDGRQILIPDVDAFVRKLDGAEKRLEVELIPGFL